MSRPNYLTSVSRRSKRGLLVEQTRTAYVQFLRAEKRPIDLLNLPCLVCGGVFHPEMMHMHEIVRRGLVTNKEVLEQLPVELHVLLCPVCNLKRADQAKYVRLILTRACGLWGKKQVIEAVKAFNALLVEHNGFPLSRSIFPYSVLE